MSRVWYPQVLLLTILVGQRDDIGGLVRFPRFIQHSRHDIKGQVFGFQWLECGGVESELPLSSFDHSSHRLLGKDVLVGGLELLAMS